MATAAAPGVMPRLARLGRVLMMLAVAWLLLQPVAAGGKHACVYSKNLCRWQAAYGQGATVLKDKVRECGCVYSGGCRSPPR